MLCIHPDFHLISIKYFVQEFKGRIGAQKVDAVDTTGAGDAFVAGLLNSLASHPTLYKVHFFLFPTSFLLKSSSFNPYTQFFRR